MKRLIERLQPLKTAVKSVFFISIAVLVVVELIRLNRWSQLYQVCQFGILL